MAQAFADKNSEDAPFQGEDNCCNDKTEAPQSKKHLKIRQLDPFSGYNRLPCVLTDVFRQPLFSEIAQYSGFVQVHNSERKLNACSGDNLHVLETLIMTQERITVGLKHMTLDLVSNTYVRENTSLYGDPFGIASARALG